MLMFDIHTSPLDPIALTMWGRQVSWALCPAFSRTVLDELFMAVASDGV